MNTIQAIRHKWNKWKKLFDSTHVTAKRKSEQLLDSEGLRVFATSVIRGSENRDLTGYLFEIDWSNGEIVERIPIPINTGNPFWNSRGGNRGGRGICTHDGNLYVATAMSVLKYDSELNLVDEITHPYLAGLHEISVTDDGIWYTSTVHDLVVKTDHSGENLLDEWWGSESSVMQERFNYESRSLNLELDFSPSSFQEEYDEYCSEERLHINSVSVVGQRVFVLSSRQNALIQIRPQPEQVIIRDSSLSAPHNAVIFDGKVFINSTSDQAIHCYDLNKGNVSKVLSTKLEKNQGKSVQFAKPGWQRGIVRSSNTNFIVGTSPATIFEVNFESNIIGKILNLDDNVRHCIHDVTQSYKL